MQEAESTVVVGPAVPAPPPHDERGAAGAPAAATCLTVRLQLPEVVALLREVAAFGPRYARRPPAQALDSTAALAGPQFMLCLHGLTLELRKAAELELEASLAGLRLIDEAAAAGALHAYRSRVTGWLSKCSSGLLTNWKRRFCTPHARRRGATASGLGPSSSIANHCCMVALHQRRGA
jgi:hypothetical protein